MGYDPSELNEQAESAEAPDGEATITEVVETTAGSVYENTNLDNPDKGMIEVTAETADGQEVTEVFGLPESESSWYNPNFKLGRFKERYGSVPAEDMTVEVSVDEDSGFLSIDF